MGRLGSVGSMIDGELEVLRRKLVEQEAQMKAVSELIHCVVCAHGAFRDLHSELTAQQRDLSAQHRALCDCLCGAGVVSKVDLQDKLETLRHGRGFGKLLEEPPVMRSIASSLSFSGACRLCATSPLLLESIAGSVMEMDAPFRAMPTDLGGRAAATLIQAIFENLPSALEGTPRIPSSSSSARSGTPRARRPGASEWLAPPAPKPGSVAGSSPFRRRSPRGKWDRARESQAPRDPEGGLFFELLQTAEQCPFLAGLLLRLLGVRDLSRLGTVSLVGRACWTVALDTMPEAQSHASLLQKMRDCGRGAGRGCRATWAARVQSGGLPESDAMALFHEVWQHPRLAEMLIRAMGQPSENAFRSASSVGRECVQREGSGSSCAASLQHVWRHAAVAEVLARSMGSSSAKHVSSVSRAGRAGMLGLRARARSSPRPAPSPSSPASAASGRRRAAPFPGVSPTSPREREARRPAYGSSSSEEAEAEAGLELPDRRGPYSFCSSSGASSSSSSSSTLAPSQKSLPDDFHVDDVVRLHNLRTRVDLNGRWAKLLQRTDVADRWHVLVLDTEENVRVSTANLQTEASSTPKSSQHLEALALVLRDPRVVARLEGFAGSACLLALEHSSKLLATAFRSHTQLFVCGGCDGKAALSSVEAFDAATGRWRELPPMRRYHDSASMAVVGRHLYVFGGSDPHGPLSYVESLDLATGRWEVERPLRVPRVFAAVEVWGGCIYICGGCRSMTMALRSVELYSPRSRHWSPLPRMHQARSNATSAAFQGHVYVCGGSDGRALQTVEALDTVKREWRTLPSMEETRIFPGRARGDGYVYVCGGQGPDGSPLTSTEVFHIRQASWEKLPPLAAGRVGPSLSVTGPRRLIVCGGCPRTGPCVESFDPAAGAWRTLRPMLHSRKFAASVLHAGHVYICGGSVNGTVISSVERLNLETGLWEEVAEMNSPRLGSVVHGSSQAALAGCAADRQ